MLLGGAIPTAFFLPLQNAVVIGYRTAVVPDRLTGRVGSVARSIALCTAAFGPLSAGLLLHAYSRAHDGRGLRRRDARCSRCSGRSIPRIRNAPSLRELDDLPRAPEPETPALAG